VKRNQNRIYCIKHQTYKKRGHMYGFYRSEICEGRKDIKNEAHVSLRR